MKNKKIILFIIIFFCLVFVKVGAEEIVPPPEAPVVPDPITIHLTIATDTENLYDSDLSVTPCDSDNGATSEVKITAYCAILQSGVQSDWNWAWAPGAFLNSLGNISGSTTKDKDGNDVYHYWNWSSNGTDGVIGLNQYDLSTNDQIKLTFIDPKEPAEEVIIKEEPRSSSSGSSRTYTTTTTKPEAKTEQKSFDLEKAFQFLIANQKENGSFGVNLYTDWATIALMSSDKYQDAKIKLIKYYSSDTFTGELLTDYERRAMAIMSLGLNPFNLNDVNYIEKIKSGFDGEQFGDKEQINDDIFALIVLGNINEEENKPIIEKTVEFILSKQKENGSWNDNVDITSATIVALNNISESNCSIFGGENSLLQGVSQADGPRASVSKVSGDSDLGKDEFPPEKICQAFQKAKEYLKQNQKEDGGFGNVSSTAWATQGILSLGEKPEDWPARNADSIATAGGIKNGNTPFDYLAANQDQDGAMVNSDLESKLWETSYVLTALSGKTWNQIMQKFDTPPFENDRVISQKKEIEKATSIKKLNKIAKENIASPVGALNNEIAQPIKNQNWFRRLINKIFGI